jgi:hypothetical protein
MKSLQKHPLWKLLKDCLQLSDEQLCKELNVRGHDVPADKLAAMLSLSSISLTIQYLLMPDYLLSKIHLSPYCSSASPAN